MSSLAIGANTPAATMHKDEAPSVNLPPHVQAADTVGRKALEENECLKTPGQKIGCGMCLSMTCIGMIWGIPMVLEGMDGWMKE